jgi:hypothetical protein
MDEVFVGLKDNQSVGIQLAVHGNVEEVGFGATPLAYRLELADRLQ